MSFATDAAASTPNVQIVHFIWVGDLNTVQKKLACRLGVSSLCHRYDQAFVNFLIILSHNLTHIDLTSAILKTLYKIKNTSVALAHFLDGDIVKLENLVFRHFQKVVDDSSDGTKLKSQYKILYYKVRSVEKTTTLFTVEEINKIKALSGESEIVAQPERYVFSFEEHRDFDTSHYQDSAFFQSSVDFFTSEEVLRRTQPILGCEVECSPFR